MSVDNAGHPQVDFVWGNAPMQPNTERGVNVLDPLLDSHEIAYLGWNGFPGYVPNTTSGNAGSGSGSGGSGSVPTTATVPNVIGLTLAQAFYALTGAGLLGDNNLSSSNGATPENNGLVFVQSIAPGTAVALGTYVVIGAYVYAG